MTIDLLQEERRVMKRRINAWLPDYQAALDGHSGNPASTLDQWIETVWQKGILDHVSPVDPEIRDIRQRLEKTLWQSREDPALYLRILYSLERLRLRFALGEFGMVHFHALTSLLSQMVGDKNLVLRLFPQAEKNAAYPWPQHILEALIARARKAVRDAGAPVHEPLLTPGARGMFQDIPCEIVRICDDGTLWIKPTSRQEQIAHGLKLVELMTLLTPSGDAICPSLFDPSAFTQPKDH